ncbi:MAG: 4-hydroxythreonine-4-phosphate dehydrogenase PdxA [Chloroflexi bacterium]|nr:4-hydroxythreonine-4-phosphate dehydrogenase PdxA [Chloroflexota bacterium]
MAITMGDAAGVGPEVIVKALLVEQVFAVCRPLVIGDGGVVRKAIELVKAPLRVRSVVAPAEARGAFGSLDLLDLHNLDEVVPGRLSAACGKAAMEYVAKGAELQGGEVAALVTAPINKEASKLAGYGDVGHLEFLARLTGATEYATMLVSGSLRVVHLTTHYALKEACNLVTRERILGKVKLTHESFTRWGIKYPRIAVAALNPHAGEGGMLGSEEIDEIEPAIREAEGLGIDAQGPLPADSVFNRALGGEFDVVLAMYHDQGHIPIKVHGFEKSVSVALGLPFVRTSVDHGTAFDIAWKGVADAQSLVEAIKMAVSLSSGTGLIDT